MNATTKKAAFALECILDAYLDDYRELHNKTNVGWSLKEKRKLDALNEAFSAAMRLKEGGVDIEIPDFEGFSNFDENAEQG